MVKHWGAWIQFIGLFLVHAIERYLNVCRYIFEYIYEFKFGVRFGWEAWKLHQFDNKNENSLGEYIFLDSCQAIKYELIIQYNYDQVN